MPKRQHTLLRHEDSVHHFNQGLITPPKTMSMETTLSKKIGWGGGWAMKKLVFSVCVTREEKKEQNANRQNAHTIKNIQHAARARVQNINLNQTAHFLLTRTQYPHASIQTNLPGHTVVPSD